MIRFVSVIRKLAPKPRAPALATRPPRRRESPLAELTYDLLNDVREMIPLTKLRGMVAELSHDEIVDGLNAGKFDEIGERLSSALEKIVTSSARELARERGTEHGASPNEIAAWSDDVSKRIASQLLEQARESIRITLEAGEEQGRTAKQIASDLQRTIGLSSTQARSVANRRRALAEQGVKKSRADNIADDYADRLLEARCDTIAATEDTAAINAGRQMVAEAADAIGYTWTSRRDAKTCERCAALHGVQVRRGEDFESEGEALSSPPLHPNCRCWLAPTKLEGEAKEKRES